MKKERNRQEDGISYRYENPTEFIKSPSEWNIDDNRVTNYDSIDLRKVNW